MKNPIPVVLALLACARAAGAPLADTNSENVVITAGALPGTSIDPAKIPVNSETLSGVDLSRFGTSNALGALNNATSGVSFADAQSNPFQPNLFYRGFEASPLAGDAQGIAVYANGVRLNQPFGDTMNWDLVPDIAIDRLTLEGSNPVFGLNALGGSVAILLKNGFTYRGAEGEGMAGSFGRWQGAFQYGAGNANRSLYVAGNVLTESGWRDHSPSRLQQGFADFGWRADGADIHLELMGAKNDLTGNGTAPVELLAVDRSAVFTFPDRTRNSYGLANLRGTIQANDALSFQGNLYVSRLQQRTRNGDASEAEPCGAFLCLEGGEVLTDENGDAIPDFVPGGPYAQLNTTSTNTTGYGGALQASYRAPVVGRTNRLFAGFAFDGGHTRFAANSEIGALTDERGFGEPGVPIHQEDGSIAPVRVASDNAYYGIYASDIVDLTEALTVTLSGRYNVAKIDLSDKLGGPLNGSHTYSRFNPAIGANYALASSFSIYAGYSEANRAPTPAEFSCADPNAPCSLTNFFVGDPELKQVAARTFEGGLRFAAEGDGDRSFKWHAGLYRTDADDDILFAASTIVGRAFFRNVGGTRRQGLETSADFVLGPWSASLDYSYTEATFRSALVLNSPENPRADAAGHISVRPGDRMPSVPAHILKATIVYRPSEAWTIAAAARAASGVYLQGDESNLDPKTDAYAVFDVSSSYRIGERFELFATIANLFDADYATFGTFSPVDAVPIAQVPGASDTRSLSPAPPRAFFGGMRVHL